MVQCKKLIGSRYSRNSWLGPARLKEQMRYSGL